MKSASPTSSKRAGKSSKDGSGAESWSRLGKGVQDLATIAAHDGLIRMVTRWLRRLLGVGGEFIMLRVTIALAALMAAGPSTAEQLNVEAARQFVVGKLFAFSCFEGTRGAGRIYSDGSVAGTVQFGGSGPARYLVLPARTVRAGGQSVFASG